MKTNISETNSDNGVPREDECSSDDEQYETESAHRAPGVDPPSIAMTGPQTVARFYMRLRSDLYARGLDYDRMAKFTTVDDEPPCFTANKTSFAAWAAQASLIGATVPYRLDFPAEPNYCHDCTRDFQRRAVADGVCQFPHLKFEKTETLLKAHGRTTIEVEIIGIARNREIAIAQAQERSLLEEFE